MMCEHQEYIDYLQFHEQEERREGANRPSKLVRCWECGKVIHRPVEATA